MQNTKLFASVVIAAACLTSACGKDSKKKDPAPASTLYHLMTEGGFCMEVVREQMLARGMDVTDAATRGACPDQFNLEGAGQVTRYATCPVVSDEGVPMTAIFYTKLVADDGEVLDLTLLTPEKVCEIANDE